MNLYIKKQDFFWRKTALSFLVFLTVMIGLNIFQAPVRSSFFWVTSPISRSCSYIASSMAKVFSSFLNFGGIKQENISLQEQNASLLFQIANLRASLLFDQDTKQAHQNTSGDQFQLLAVNSIGLDRQNDILLIDKGSNDGITENMPVISKEKVLFGRVVKVHATFSRVMLISSTKSALAVKIERNASPAPLQGVVKGSGNLSAFMDLISSDVVLSSGDLLVTSSQEGVFPKDLLVGTVGDVASNDAKAFQSAHVNPLFDALTANTLFIITNYLQP